jgi:hypothetical protein
MHGSALASELVDGLKDAHDMQGVVPRRDRVGDLLVLKVLNAILELFTLAQDSRVRVIDDSSEDLAELAAIELCGFPVALDEAAFRGNEFVKELRAKQVVERRAQLRKQLLLLNEGHRLALLVGLPKRLPH